MPTTAAELSCLPGRSIPSGQLDQCNIQLLISAMCKDGIEPKAVRKCLALTNHSISGYFGLASQDALLETLYLLSVPGHLLPTSLRYLCRSTPQRVLACSSCPGRGLCSQPWRTCIRAQAQATSPYTDRGTVQLMACIWHPRFCLT